MKSHCYLNLTFRLWDLCQVLGKQRRLKWKGICWIKPCFLTILFINRCNGSTYPMAFYILRIDNVSKPFSMLTGLTKNSKMLIIIIKIFMKWFGSTIFGIIDVQGFYNNVVSAKLRQWSHKLLVTNSVPNWSMCQWQEYFLIISLLSNSFIYLFFPPTHILYDPLIPAVFSLYVNLPHSFFPYFFKYFSNFFACFSFYHLCPMLIALAIMLHLGACPATVFSYRALGLDLSHQNVSWAM